jgi:hypothetical protein
VSEDGYRAVLMHKIKTAFGKLAMWSRIETDMAVKVSNVPEPTNEDKKTAVITHLSNIKKFLQENGIADDELTFLDEEIDTFENTTQMSLYHENDIALPPKTVDRYAELVYSTEGVVRIHKDFNYEQLKRLTYGVFQKTGMVKFYISKERTIQGKIIAEVYETQQSIPVATVVATKKLSKDTGMPLQTRVALFGERWNKASYVFQKEVTAPFYVYRFIDELNTEYILFSINKMPVGDYVVTGVMTRCDDQKQLTESAKLPTKLPFIFAQSLQNRIIKFENHDEFRKQLGLLNITKSNFFDYPFTLDIERDGKQVTVITRHPTWFKWLMWGWLCHNRKGILNKYPLHIMIVGPPGSGKSILMGALHSKSRESQDIFSGRSSTLKRLIPSFKEKPAKIGYLAESNRFAFLDEFLSCVVNTSTNTANNQRDESLARMNDLLEHQKRQFGSGISTANVAMTSRCISTTNPVRGVKSMSDLLHILEESSISRWFVYYQHENGEHVRMIRESISSDLKEYKYNVDSREWVAILDYLWTFSARYEEERLDGIFKAVLPVLSADLLRHYDVRHKHHLECIMDGIVKARCLFEHDMSFKANEEDYATCDEVWNRVINSWVDGDMVKHMPLERRIFYLPENAQFLFNKICSAKRAISRIESEDLVKGELNARQYLESFIILRENGLIYDHDNVIRPHYMSAGGYGVAEGGLLVNYEDMNNVGEDDVNK